MGRPPIFIVTTGENGAGLVQGLLDGHPALSNLPFIVDFFAIHRKVAGEGAIAAPTGALVEALVRYPMVERVFNRKASQAYGDFRNCAFSKIAFVSRFAERAGSKDVLEKTAFLEASCDAFAHAFGLDPNATFVLHTHFPATIAEYVDAYPEAKIVVCTAQLQNMLAYSSVTIPRILAKKAVPFRIQMAERKATLCERIAIAAGLPKTRTLPVAFETLLTDPTRVADELARFLGIARDDSLFSSTTFGHPLACRYPTGEFTIRNGKTEAKDPKFGALLDGKPERMSPFHLRHYRTEWPVDRPYGVRDTVSSLSASARQCIVEIGDSLGRIGRGGPDDRQAA